MQALTDKIISASAARCSVCLLYWYNSTNTDAGGRLGAQFACFTGIIVQILTQKARLGAQFAGFTGTIVRILTNIHELSFLYEKGRYRQRFTVNAGLLLMPH